MPLFTNYFSKERRLYFKKAYTNLKRHKGRSTLIIVFSFATSLFDGFSLGAIIPFFQSMLGDNVPGEPIFPIFEETQRRLLEGSQSDAILIIMTFALSMIILKSIFNYFRTTNVSRVTNDIRKDLQNEMFKTVTDSSYNFYSRMKTGSIIGSITVYTNNIVAFYLVLLNLVAIIARLTVYGTLLFLVSWKLTVLAIVFELAVLPLIKHIFVKLKHISQETTKAVADLHSKMTELFGNIRVSKIFGTERYEKRHFNALATNLANLEYRSVAYQSAITPITETTIMAAIIVLFFVSIKILQLNIIVFIPTIVAYLYVFMRTYREINTFLESFSNLLRHMEPYKEFEKLRIDASREIPQRGSVKIKEFTDTITFSDVSFSYGDTPIFKDIDLEIPRGSHIGIVGSTGSGKTTIANLIAGLLPINSGSLTVDGTDIHDVEIKGWRSKIGYISQEVVIFNDSAHANIAYGSFTANKKKVVEAAKIAGIHDFITSLPEGYDTPLGEHGSRLSGGQRQRIAIARAIVRDPEILILDEATSSLDAETEQAVQNALEQAMSHRTIISITHRIATASQADQIIVLDQGIIAEHGTHTALMKKNGIYKKLHDLQMSE